MGAGQSAEVYIPTNPPPPRRVEDDYPLQQPIGISKGEAEGCQSPTGGVCQLAVPQGVSSSSANLYRDQGTIRRDQCRRYAADLRKVANNEKSFEEVKKDLIAGLYYEELSNGYCRQITYAPEDIKAVLSPDKLPQDKVRYNSIRAMSDSGSYSSVTKLFIKPSIPFQIEFNGKPHKISVMTLMHPSPIRMENIQHDAMLTLGDPADGNNDGLVVLVPLQGAITAGASGTFINKVVRYMTSVLQPDPATGDYKTVDIPTGNDWDLSKLFPGTPENGKTYVTNVGYYVWIGYPPLELTPSGSATASTVKRWFGNWFLREPGIQRYAWKPTQREGIQYLMLSKPALVSSVDLQTIRMLPVTPVTEAVAPIVKWTLSYRKAGKVGADGTWESQCSSSSSPTGAITDLFTGGASREGVDETLESRCDPFAPGAFPDTTDRDLLVNVIIGTLTTLAVFLAIYAAVYFFTKTKWGQWAAHQGTLAGNYIAQAFESDERKRLPADKRFDVTPEMEEKEKREAAKKAADEKVKAAEEKLRAELARAAEEKRTTANERRRAGIAAAAAEGEAIVAAEDAAKQPPVKPDDIVVSPQLPAPGTPAANAIAAAEQEATQPPVKPDDIVVSPQLPAPGTPAANAVAAAEPPQESRADMFRRRAQEAAKKAKEDAAKTGPAIPPDTAYRSPAVAPKRKPRKPVEPSESKAEAAERVDALEAAEGKVPEDFDADEAVREQAKALREVTAMNRETEKGIAELRALARGVVQDAKTKKMMAEIAALEADTEEAKTRAQKATEKADEAKIAAEELAKKPKPSGPKSFANAASANGPTIEQRAAKKEAERLAKEADAAAERAMVDARRAAEAKAEIKRKAEEKRKADAEAAAKAEAEAEIQRRAKEAAESASKVVESRAAAAAVPKPAAAVPPHLRGAPKSEPAKDADVKTLLDAVAATTKQVKAAGRALPPSKTKEKLDEAKFKEVTEPLKKLQTKIYELWMPAVTRSLGFNGAQWKGRGVGMRFGEEEKYHTKTLVPATRDVVRFKEAIEASELPDSQRTDYVTNLNKFTTKLLTALEAVAYRLNHLEEGAVPGIIFKGGRRMKRKSTRRYVA